jgi:diaminopimelate epimerase
MATIPFTKVQGTGNDFVLLDGRRCELDWPALAREICDRHFGVGADGLLVARDSDAAPVRMVMYNPDGSLAEMCGNGLRCFVKYAVERGGLSANNGAIDVDTGAGVLSATFDQPDGVIERVRLSMGAPRFDPADIPIATDGPVDASGPLLGIPIHVDGKYYSVTPLSMGNPHAVHFTDTPVDEIDFHTLGPAMEHHEAFPQRTNFEVVNVLAPDHLRMRVWERGAGLTLACGTGAAAAMVAARLHGHVGPSATISLPGGDLQLEWDGPVTSGHGHEPTPPVYLEGPAAYVFDGEWNLNGHA